jgi:hypothetical protein
VDAGEREAGEPLGDGRVDRPGRGGEEVGKHREEDGWREHGGS